VQYLKTFDWFGLGLISALFGYLLATPWRKSLQDEPWRLSFIPVVSVTLIYLPVYAEDYRYYWVTFPFLMAASFGFTVRLSAVISKPRAIQNALALALVTLSLVIGNESAFLGAFSLTESYNPIYRASKRLANELRASGLVGPLAAAGAVPVDTRYVAYFLDVQSFGWIRNVTDADPEAILSSGTSLIIVPRGATLAQELRKDPRFASADKQLFGCGGPNKNPIEVFLTAANPSPGGEAAGC
jgi:hypothetical protein